MLLKNLESSEGIEVDPWLFKDDTLSISLDWFDLSLINNWETYIIWYDQAKWCFLPLKRSRSPSMAITNLQPIPIFSSINHFNFAKFILSDQLRHSFNVPEIKKKYIKRIYGCRTRCIRLFCVAISFAKRILYSFQWSG